MLHSIGKCLILFGISALGFVQAARLRRRLSCLRDFLGALECLERELSFALLPVEELLLRMKEGSRQEALIFFQHCEMSFVARGEERLEEIWIQALLEVPLPLLEEDKRVLGEIGAVLGRYDGDSQQQAFGRIHARLETLRDEAGEEAARMGKVYTVLGLVGGLFVVLLL